MKHVVSRLLDTVLCGAMHVLTCLSVAFLVMVRCIGRKTERKGAVSCGKEQKSGQRKSED